MRCRLILALSFIFLLSHTVRAEGEWNLSGQISFYGLETYGEETNFKFKLDLESSQKESFTLDGQVYNLVKEDPLAKGVVYNFVDPKNEDKKLFLVYGKNAAQMIIKEIMDNTPFEVVKKQRIHNCTKKDYDAFVQVQADSIHGACFVLKKQ